MFRAEENIQKKRDGEALSGLELSAFVEGVSDGVVSDAQIAAFTMATWFNGMQAGETTALTLAMRDSGKVLDWPDLDGPVLDKHSTGGVGDMVSLLLGPVVAACGGYVPMISGRGLGHTGGTLDKLESIPGFQTSVGTGRLGKLLRTTGIAIIGQSDELAPADRRIYAVRDVTATVSSPPLMISSILSKKLAEGLDGLVLDIKYGSGAFTATASEALALAEQMAAVAIEAGVDCSALVTDMHAPLAWSAGNALEVREAIRFLRGEAMHPRLREVTLGLCGELLMLGGLAPSASEGENMAESCLASGRAAETFAVMVAGQGGPGDLVDEPQKHLDQASCIRPVAAGRAGFVSAIDTKAVGSAVVMLGGGRLRAGQDIDPAVGLDELLTVGDRVEADTPLGVVHTGDETSWENAARMLRDAYTLADAAPHPGSLVHARTAGGE